MRKCSTCGIEKRTQDFGLDKGCKNNGGRKHACKECINAKRRGRYAKENRARYLKSKYGLTEEKFNQMYTKQGGLCAICGEPGDKRSGGGRAKDSTRLFIDHDHVSGEVRGLLCHKCNVALGLLNDDPKRIEVAAAYIRGLPVEYTRVFKCVS